MKTKFKLSNRILSLVLALVMVLGMLPNLALKTEAASGTLDYGFSFVMWEDNTWVMTYNTTYESATLSKGSSPGTWILTLYNVKSDICGETIDKVEYTFEGVNCTSSYAQTVIKSRWTLFGGQYHHPDLSQAYHLDVQLKRSEGHTVTSWTSNYDNQNHKGTCSTCGETVSENCYGGTATCTDRAQCTACGAQYGTVNADNHNWLDWISTREGKHVRLCNNDPSHTDVGNCNHVPATCLAASVCSVCGYTYEAQKSHSYTYTADGSVLTEKCTNGCGHQAVADIVAGEAIYTGSEITNTATISYTAGTWVGDEPVLSFEDNVNVGTATAKITASDATASTTFKINPANIRYTTVTLDPENGTYNGSAYTPNITVIFNGTPLMKDTDYTVSWDKSGFTNADYYTATITGKSNFVGTQTTVFHIEPAEINGASVTLDQNTFVYDGTAHKPNATVTFNGTPLTEGVDYELYYVSSDNIMKWNNGEPEKFFGTGKENCDSINAGQYYAVAFGKGNFADNGKFAYAKYVIEKVIVTEPTIASKPYTGEAQTADIPASDLYTVTQNNGGTGVKLSGYYDVVLELKDAANYKWSSTDDAEITVKFAITRATNEWTASPSISGWTYGEPAKAPVGTAKFGDVSTQYTGTANDGTQFDSTTAPTKAGNYTATFIVAETEDYSGLETSVDFTVAKATYDMTDAKWDYTKAIKYDGELHSVWVDESSLPDGVSVSRYTGNTASDAGKYTANVSFIYDYINYNQPEFNYLLEWEIKQDWSHTENIEKVKDVTGENVTPEDKTDLENAQTDLEKALENDELYTEDEKKAIEDALVRIKDALAVIGNAEAITEMINALPERITKNDEATVKVADDAFNALTDYEKTLVDEDTKKALDNAKAALAELNTPVDSTFPNTGDSRLWVWIALLLASGIGLFGILLSKKKKGTE